MPLLSRREWLAAVSASSLTAAEYPQHRRDVTSQFEAAKGLRVTQITDSQLGNQLSYYDIPCYLPSANRIVYNTIVSAPAGKPGKKVGKGSDQALWGVASSGLDGSAPRLLVTRAPATASTTRVDMSTDGKLITYTKVNPDNGVTWDLYGFRTSLASEFRISNLNTPVGLTRKVKTSPPSWDAKVGKYLCAFSIDDKVFLFHDDGKQPVTAQLTDLDDFPERKAEDMSFHRIRLNPVFPNLLYYRRNGVSDNWLVDLSQPQPRSRRISGYTKSIHATWSADGRMLAGSMHGPWVTWRVADAGGRLTKDFEQSEIGTFGSGAKAGIFYGCYASDSKKIAIATRYDQEPGGSIWLMDAASGKAVYLCKARYFGPVTEGQPRMGFVDNGRALAFSSDNSVGLADSKPPQVFVIGPLPKL